MPYLKIQTNQVFDVSTQNELLKKATATASVDA